MRLRGPLSLVVVSLIAVRAVSADGFRSLSAGQEHFSRTIKVADFGARCDGVADDTAAIRSAANAIPTAGAILHFPSGVCVTHGTIYLKSHTHVLGDRTTLLAAPPWTADHKYGYAIIENVHHDADSITDEDISIRGMTFDYGAFAPVVTPGGGKHAVRFEYVRNVVVQSNLFMLRGAEDAVAGLGVDNMLVQDNSAYEFRNCAYDFWSAPTNVRIIGNYAETEKSAQMVNFNPERNNGQNAGAVAKGLEMSDNTLVVTGAQAVGSMIEPLGTGTSVRDVTIVGNRLHNAFLVLRGNVAGARVDDNIIADVAGGASAFATYSHWGARGNSIEFSRNTIIDPQTHRPELGVIRMEADRSTVTGNVVIGSAYSTGKIYRGSFSGEDKDNIFRN